MAEVIRMPLMSDTMKEGVIVEWHKKVGDKVKSGDILAEVETDKATMELENYDEGTLLYIGVKKGDSVPVDGILAIIGEKGEDYKELLEKEKSGSSEADNTEKEDEDEKVEKDDEAENDEKANTNKEEKEEVLAEKKQGSEKVKKESVSDDKSRTVKASPLAKKIAREHDIDISKINGSGDNDRIIKRDIEAWLEKADSNEISTGTESYEDVAVSQMRKTIASRLSESKFSAPHYYLNMEIDMGAAIVARKKINESSDADKISINDMIIKSAAMALRKHPQVNASWLKDKIRYYKHIHIGVAVAVDDGLLVPVVKFADSKGFSSISKEVKDFAEKAKNKKLQPEDWQGNTFTISNLGMFDIESFTAIINPPDACILAVGGIKEVPAFNGDEVIKKHIMKVTLSCDHRIVDGVTGSKFLLTLKSYLEEPVNMLV